MFVHLDDFKGISEEGILSQIVKRLGEFGFQWGLQIGVQEKGPDRGLIV